MEVEEASSYETPAILCLKGIFFLEEIQNFSHFVSSNDQHYFKNMNTTLFVINFVFEKQILKR